MALQSQGKLGDKIATGSTAKRPTGQDGFLRYNTSLGTVEYYVEAEGIWKSACAADFGDGSIDLVGGEGIKVNGSNITANSSSNVTKKVLFDKEWGDATFASPDETTLAAAAISISLGYNGVTPHDTRPRGGDGVGYWKSSQVAMVSNHANCDFTVFFAEDMPSTNYVILVGSCSRAQEVDHCPKLTQGGPGGTPVYKEPDGVRLCFGGKNGPGTQAAGGRIDYYSVIIVLV